MKQLTGVIVVIGSVCVMSAWLTRDPTVIVLAPLTALGIYYLLRGLQG